MYLTQNIIKSFKELSFCILIFLISCSKATSTNIYVSDVSWKMESERSETLNNVNKYCILYKNDFVKKKDIGMYDIKGLGNTIANFLKIKNVKVDTNYLIVSIEKIKNSKTENNEFIENLKKEEKNNNYKNCDYLIFYSVWSSESGKHNKKYTTATHIMVFDIRKNKITSSYGLDGKDNSFFDKTYPKLEEFIDEALEKWWKKTQE